MNQIINAFFPSALALSCVSGGILYYRLDQWDLRDRWLAAMIAPASVILAGSFFRLMLQAPFDFWESLRLLPAYLLSKGIPLYYPPHAGPVLDMMYGPMTAVAYWPITLVTQRPDMAAMGAKFLTVSYYFLPVLWLVLRDRDSHTNSHVFGICLFIEFALYSLASDVLRPSAYGNHSDAPALGFSAIACLILLYRSKENTPWVFLLSALFTVMAAWTKQVAVPLLIALPVYLWLADGPRSALRFTGYLCLVSGLSLALFGHLFGLKNMIFNLVVHPSSEPWENELLKVQGRAVVELLQECRWMLMVLVFYVAYELRPSASPRVNGENWFKDHDMGLFILVGLFMIPTSVVGRLKIEGALNALSYSVYFFALAVGQLFIEMVSKPEPFPHDRVAKGLIKVGTLFMLTSAILIRTPTLLYYYVHFSDTLNEVHQNPLKRAYFYVKAHPGEVYIPRNPLVTFLAEGKLYHFDFSIGERAMAGYPITDEHFRAYLPSRIRWVVYAPLELDEYVLRFLPDFTKRVELVEFPDWKVYTRS